jgi:type IV pilus assembly protein PilO
MSPLTNPATNPAFRGKLLSILNLHLAGVALLIILNLFLATRLFLAWRAAGADREDQIAAAQLTYAQLQAQTARLSGLPQKVDRARNGAATFYDERLPGNYSAIAGALGELYVQDGVHLARASYAQSPAVLDLAEVRIDANVTGEYNNIARFINGIERDKTFFVIDSLTLTGQQGGTVNLRLRMTTYLHGADAMAPATLEEISTRPSIEGVR